MKKIKDILLFIGGILLILAVLGLVILAAYYKYKKMMFFIGN